jgi:hypothetical protein
LDVIVAIEREADRRVSCQSLCFRVYPRTSQRRQECVPKRVKVHHASQVVLVWDVGSLGVTSNHC